MLCYRNVHSNTEKYKYLDGLTGIFKNSSVLLYHIPEEIFAGSPMVSVNESKIFCLYCRGEITQHERNNLKSSQIQQYHQECYNEIIKDNHCEFCSKFLNELNSFFTEDKVKIHQQCLIDLKSELREKITNQVGNYLQDMPIKKLAKDYALYELKEKQFTFYVDDLEEFITPQLHDVSGTSEEFQVFTSKITNEVVQEVIAEYIKNTLQLKLDDELKACRSDSKKEIVNKTLSFVWYYYLEIPISYKDKLHHKILPKPVLDTVNYTIFHFTLEKLFNTALDFNSIVNSNYNELTDYLLDQPISWHHVQM